MEHDGRFFAESNGAGWTVTPVFVPLGENEVQIWRVKAAPDGPLYQVCHGMLQSDELSRLARLRAGVARDEFVVARGCLRALLGAASGSDPRNIVIGAGPHGKPFVQGIDFNVTHSKGLILIALSRGAAVGIDVEWIDPGIEALEIAQDTFTLNEIARIAEARPEEKADFFYHCWVRKEAVTKAHGQGITLPLKDFEVEPSKMQEAEVQVTDETTGQIRCFQVQGIPLEGNFAGALAIEAANRRICLFELSLETISSLRMNAVQG